MKILALDLGTQLGWARIHEWPWDGVAVGTLVLAGAGDLKYAKKMRMDRRLDIRVSALTKWLESEPAKPDWIVFEDVRFASSQAQAHLWASFRGIIWSYAARHGTKTDCLDTSKLKLWTTGNGGAKKEEMAAAAIQRWPDLVRPGMDDNAFDALCLLQWARETIKV